MPAECFCPEEEASCAISRLLPPEGVLAEAVNAFYAVLDRYTLADISRNRQALAGILHFHRSRPLP